MTDSVKSALERLDYELTSDGRLTTNGYEILDAETVNTIRTALQQLALMGEVVEALERIIETRGRYSHDRFEHACNTIEDMKAIAVEALAKLKLNNKGDL